VERAAFRDVGRCYGIECSGVQGSNREFGLPHGLHGGRQKRFELADGPDANAGRLGMPSDNHAAIRYGLTMQSAGKNFACQLERRESKIVARVG